MKRKHHQPKTTSSAHGQRGEEEKALRVGTGGTQVSAQWIWHHRALLSLRNQMLHNHQEQALEASELVDANPMAPAERGTDAFDHDMSFALLAHEEDMLREIDAALARIAAGAYGICEESGERISAARLRAIPWTRYTKEVAERREQQGPRPGPHLGVLGCVSGGMPAAVGLSEESDAIAPEQTGQRRINEVGLGGDITNLSEEDALTSQEREARA